MVSSSFFLLSFFLSFFLAYSQPSHIGCLPYFHAWCGLSANLGCRSETCCTRLAESIGRKTIVKNSPSGHHRTTLSDYIFTTKTHIDNRKKLVKQRYLPTCPHNMANVSPLAAEISSLVWGTPADFIGFRVLASLLQRRRSTEANQTLHDVWPSPGLLHYIYIFGGPCPLQNSLCVQVLRSPILAALVHDTRVMASAKLWGLEQRAPPIFGRAAITLSIGLHSSFVLLARLHNFRFLLFIETDEVCMFCINFGHYNKNMVHYMCYRLLVLLTWMYMRIVCVTHYNEV